MSKENMKDIERELRDHGWVLKNIKEMFSVQCGDTIQWALENPTSRTNLILEFYIIDDLGNSTSDLNNIFYCIETRSATKLYFDKRHTDTWHENVKRFVNSVCHSVPQ